MENVRPDFTYDSWGPLMSWFYGQISFKVVIDLEGFRTNLVTLLKECISAEISAQNWPFGTPNSIFHGLKMPYLSAESRKRGLDLYQFHAA